jgi:hypothetical protein
MQQSDVGCNLASCVRIEQVEDNKEQSPARDQLGHIKGRALCLFWFCVQCIEDDLGCYGGEEAYLGNVLILSVHEGACVGWQTIWRPESSSWRG